MASKYGKGGVDYNSASLPQKKKVEKNEELIRNSADFRRSEIQRAQNVIANREQSNMDTSAQRKYLNRLMSYEEKANQSKPPQPLPPQPPQGGNFQPAPAPQIPQQPRFDVQGALNQLQGQIQNQSDAYFQNQKAQLEMAKQSQIAELQKAYSDAVAQGKMSIREAKQAFEEQEQAINQQAYLDAQKTQLTAQDRGIQNSQQLMGMMASDNSRKNNMINENMSDRNTRISNIKDRINAITKQKDLDIAQANVQYNQGLLGARGKADMMASQQMFDLGANQLQTQQSQQFQRDMANQQFQQQWAQMNAQNQFKSQQNALQRNFQQELQEDQQAYGLEKLQKAQNFDWRKFQAGVKHDISKMNMGHKLDMKEIDKKFEQELEAMAKQFGYSSSLNSQRAQAGINRMKEKMKLEMEAEQKAYEKSLQRTADKYGVASNEYAVHKAQMKEKRDNAMSELFTKFQFDTTSQMIANESQNAPKKPEPLTGGNGIGGWFNSWGGIYDSQPSDAQIRENNAKWEAYNRFIQRQDDFWDDGQLNNSN